jgi:peptidyl-prolyl cis-trans isomerase SurA
MINVLKFIFVFLTFISFNLGLAAQKNEDILMRVGKSDVTVGEFKYIYEKNNGANADYSAKSLDEYLDLYRKFKLKVEKAKEMKIDTISALVQELEGYRKQLASTYLIDKEVTDQLLRELYDRMKYDIEFSHIFIQMPETSSFLAKEDAKNRLREIKSKIVGGSLSFEEAARTFSEDRITAPHNGLMGYFTAKLPSGFYNLESAIYTLPEGTVSDIIETKIGYHLVKVIGKRPARGTIEVAHILINKGQEALADSVYNAIKSGTPFEAMADKFSLDAATAKNGGKLPAFGINTYDSNFENNAFSLQKNGDVSKPIMTNSGWHIIKLLKKYTPDTYEIFVKKMKSQINKDQRFEIAKLKLISNIKTSTGFKESKEEINTLALGLNEDFYTYRWNPTNLVNANNVVCTFDGNTKYTVSDFSEFCKKNTRTRLRYDSNRPIKETLDELYNEFVNEKALEYEEKLLPVKHPDFKSLMREYEEGILLFEITKINVWDRANQDTTGLKNFFDKHQGSYKWPESAQLSTFVIKSNDSKFASKVYDFAKKNDDAKIESKFNDQQKMVVITKLDCDAKSKECGTMEWKKGSMSSIKMEEDGTFSFTKLGDIKPSKQKTLAEARGYIVADYQDFLEKEWIASISKEIKVEMKQDVINKLKK